MQKYIFTLLLVAVTATAVGRNPKKSTDQLKAECGKELYHRNHQHVDSLATLLLQRGEQENDKHILAYANFYRGAARMMLGKGSTAQYSLIKAREMAMQINDDTLTALVLNSLAIYEGSVNANMFVAQRYFMESLRYADKSHYETIKAGIYGNLSEVALVQKDTTGIKYSLKCIEVGRNKKNDNLMYMGAFHTAEFLHLMQRNEEAIAYVDTAMMLNDKNKFHDRSTLYTLRGSIYCDMRRLQEAENYCQMGAELVAKEQPTMLPKAYYEYARVCFELKDYQRSLDLLQKGDKACKQNNTYTSIVDIYELTARCYEQLGQTQEALKYFKLARDSAYKAHSRMQQHLMNERNLVVDMMEKEQEISLREAQMLMMRRTMAALVVVVALLAVLLVVVIKNFRRRTQLYHNIVQQNKQALEREKELKNRVEQLKKEKETLATELNGQNEEPAMPTKLPASADTDEATTKQPNHQTPKLPNREILWQRLQSLMEQERIYTDNQIDREKVAQLVGTNRTYLTTMISERTGMSYTQYVNSFRVREAVAILSDKSQANYPLKNICNDLGFGSMSRFHKLFRENIGMSPSVYRDSAMKI